jgi:hypothetical protein
VVALLVDDLGPTKRPLTKPPIEMRPNAQAAAVGAVVTMLYRYSMAVVILCIFRAKSPGAISVLSAIPRKGSARAATS